LPALVKIFFSHLVSAKNLREKRRAWLLEEVDLKPPSSITKPMDNETGNGRAGIK
jgi:hypothetical protein